MPRQLGSFRKRILFWALALSTLFSIIGHRVHARELLDTEAAILFRELEMSRGSMHPESFDEIQLTLDGAQAALLLFEESDWDSLRVLCLTATQAEAMTLDRGSFYAAALGMMREIHDERSSGLEEPGGDDSPQHSARETSASRSDSTSVQESGARPNPVQPGDGPSLGEGALDKKEDPPQQLASLRCGQMLAGPLRMPPAGVERLYIAPPSALDACPFEVLSIRETGGEMVGERPDRGNGATGARRLGDALPISYVPNGSCLVGLSPPLLWSGAALVVFTDPAVSPPVSGSGPVRGAAAAIGASRGKPHMYRGSAATAEALRSIATVKPVVLHLDLVARPDGIAFDDGDGANLAESGDTTHTLSLENLRHLGLTTDLTLVSQTVASSGSIHRVPEALLTGGSRSVIVPRWPVDPRTAETFLDHFYEGLFDALPRDEAMQRARSALAEQGAPMTEQLAFAHWGAGNLPVYLIATKGSPFPLVVAWLLFLPPVIASIVWLRRRHLHRLRESSGFRG